MNKTCCVGIDIGSAQTKAVLLDKETRTVLARADLPTGWNPKQSADDVLHLLLAEKDVLVEGLVATGYGRVALPFADKNITEISCHAKGAFALFPNASVVIDIGGQDSKVISIERNGSVRDFVMNDKCAAGTGRFLQSVATLLNLDIEALCALSDKAVPCPITSMCAVFAETEIIGLLAKGTQPGSIAAGVLSSIARRIRTLAARIPIQGDCVFTGGLAKSPACARLLSKELGCQVLVPEYPQFAGALGAALAASSLNKKDLAS